MLCAARITHSVPPLGAVAVHRAHVEDAVCVGHHELLLLDAEKPPHVVEHGLAAEVLRELGAAPARHHHAAQRARPVARAVADHVAAVQMALVGVRVRLGDAVARRGAQANQHVRLDGVVDDLPSAGTSFSRRQKRANMKNT